MVKEIAWIKKFMIELRVVPSITELIKHYYYNNGVIAQVKES